MFAAALLGGPAGAQEADKAHWSCWYDHAQHLACSLETAPRAPRVSAANHLARTPWPPVVADLREQPGRWLGRLVRIPLHTEPIDASFGAALAQAVLCGTQAGCRVKVVQGEVWSPAAAAAFADLHDALLATADTD